MAQPATQHRRRCLPEAPAPAQRCLTVYAVDPSLRQALETMQIGTATVKVPWEHLEHGPVGEYLEVIDFDPPSGCFYAPVNLNQPNVLAQNGLPPSVGNPQFHQQMVYAVASLTIRNFEQALGRRALWAPGPPPPGRSKSDDSTYVQRLRIYPHALREANAYYSPSKKALLFGYFLACDDGRGDHLPGGLVFTCLSHDIIAHETAHALLDGMHRRFNQPTNPDVHAFHEAFADIVALLQHFTMPEILSHEVAKARGALRSQANMLGQLATEFGRATGLRGALRSYIGSADPDTNDWKLHTPDPKEYESTQEPHDRGAVLVSAVFDAFLSIYQARTGDLLRIASGGSGVLPAGSLHPDLVRRLSSEAAKAANQVLGMCIRALDYCPPVDLTFGEYLRALITADHDLVPDDDLGYRVAFIEAFRKRGIYPRDVRTLSEESLLWRGPEIDSTKPTPGLFGDISLLGRFAKEHLDVASREDEFKLERRMRREVHDWVAAKVLASKKRSLDADFLGIDAGRPFQVHAARFANRVGPDGNLLRELIFEIIQRAEAAGPGSQLEGGSTIVVDLAASRIKYVIRKRARSASRAVRQQEFVERPTQPSLWSSYFGASRWGTAEPFALIHRT